MYAVIKTGGKQYRVQEGDTLRVEKLAAEAGAKIQFDQVLMVGEGADVTVGTPFLSGAQVSATVLAQGRGDKIKVVKFKRRKNYLRQKGHRQAYTEVEITKIGGAGKAAAKPAAKAETTPAEKPAPEAKAKPEQKAEPKAKAPAKKTAKKPAKKAAKKTTKATTKKKTKAKTTAKKKTKK